MNRARLEAFTDGVVAIIITIMVLEIRVPRGTDLAALRADVPVLLAYVLSYVNVGIFWNNHHHMLHATERVDGKVLWELPLGGMIMASTITYAVNGRQYVAVFTGEGLTGTSNVLIDVPKMKPVRGHNALYVFALPEK